MINKEMPFLEHLEELRWRIIKSLLAIFAGSVIASFFLNEIMNILILPSKKLSSPLSLQVLTVQGMFMLKLGLGIITGFTISLPVITYQFAKFIGPALNIKEKKFIFPLVLFGYVFFIIGVTFAYKILIPFSLQYFTSLATPDIHNNYSINYYFSFLTWMILGSGIIFEMPVIVFILSMSGLLTPTFMHHYRRHTIVIILIISGFITPPDPVSLFIMAIPLVLLYEFSIGVSWMVQKSKSRNK